MVNAPVVLVKEAVAMAWSRDISFEGLSLIGAILEGTILSC